MTRSLSLKREALAALTDADLAGVVGGVEALPTLDLKYCTTAVRITDQYRSTCVNCE